MDKRIEFADGKSAGVKACRYRAVSDIMIASTDIHLQVSNYEEVERQTRKTQYRLIQTMIAVLDDASLVGWRQSYRVK
jgi:hypothetical protein